VIQHCWFPCIYYSDSTGFSRAWTGQERQFFKQFLDERRIVVTINAMQHSSATFNSCGHALHDTLIEHRIRNFDESSDVRADDEIAGLPVLFRSVPGVFKNRGHDVAQP
jgi:hypothetical protein